MSRDEDPYSLAIVGGRGYTDYKEFEEIMSEYVKKHGKPIKVVSGGAKGVDTLGKNWATSNSIPCEEFLPEWNVHGKAAANIRNTDIINAADKVLALPIGGNSIKKSSN